MKRFPCLTENSDPGLMLPPACPGTWVSVRTAPGKSPLGFLSFSAPGGCDSASARRARAGPRARARFLDLQGPAGCLPAARRRRGSRRRGRRSGAQRVKAAGAAARGGESAAPAAAGLREPAPRDRSGLSAARAERAEPGAAAPSLHLDPRKLEDGDRRRELRVRLLTRPGGCGGGHGGGDGKPRSRGGRRESVDAGQGPGWSRLATRGSP